MILKILAVPVYRDYKYHLIYQATFSTTIDHGPANYLCYVDANTGQLLMRKNMVMYEAPPSGTSTVSGEIYTSNPYNPSSIEKFKYLKAIDQNTNINYFTDNNGEVFLPSSIGTVIRYKLEGEYANVETNGVTPDIYDNLSSTNLINFDNSNSTIQERTAYWAVNEIHDHMKYYFPTYTGLDNPMQTNILMFLEVVMHILMVVLLIFMLKEEDVMQLLIYLMLFIMNMDMQLIVVDTTVLDGMAECLMVV